jgi:peptide deformylase
MALRDIIILPDKRLRLVSEPVKKIDAETKKLVADMFETMYDAPGIGLAAIQVGVPRRVITMDLSKSCFGRRTRRSRARRAACRFRSSTRRSSGRPRCA